MTAVEWRCASAAGEYTMISSSCAYRQVSMFFAYCGQMCVGSPLCNRDWFDNCSSKTLRVFICSLECILECFLSFFCFFFFLLFTLTAEIKISLSRSYFLCLRLSCNENRWFMYSLHTQSLCVILIRLVVLCAVLWVYIETTDCRTVYWRTQTISRGNANSHQFPIPCPYLQNSHISNVYYRQVKKKAASECCWWPYVNGMH